MQYGPRATHRREGEYDRTTAANDARRSVLISDDRWTDENSPQTCSGLLVGREFASPDATRTVEAMCRTRYRNLPFVLRAASTPSPRSVDSLRPWDRISTRVVAATVPRRYSSTARASAAIRSRSRNRTRTRTRTLHRSPSRPRSHPMRSVFETSWDRTAPCIFFPEDDGPTRDRFPSQHPQRRPSLLRPSLLRPSLLRPSLLRPSLLRHSLQHPSCGTRRRFSAARRGFLRRPSLATRRPRSRVPRFAPTIARRRETVRTIDESSPPRAREIRERRRGSSSCGVVDWRDPSGAFEAREEPRPAFSSRAPRISPPRGLCG